MEMQAKHGTLKPRLPIQYGKKNAALGCAPTVHINPLRVLPPVCARAEGAENIPQPSDRRPIDEPAVAADPPAHSPSNRLQLSDGKPSAPALQEARNQSSLEYSVPATTHLPPTELGPRAKSKASDAITPRLAGPHGQLSGSRPTPIPARQPGLREDLATSAPEPGHICTETSARPPLQARADADADEPPKLAFSQPIRNVPKVRPAAASVSTRRTLLQRAVPCCNMLSLPCCNTRRYGMACRSERVI